MVAGSVSLETRGHQKNSGKKSTKKQRFEFHRAVYGTREGQKIDYVSLCERLQLPEQKFSKLLNDWNQSLVVDAPYARVDATLARLLGFSQSVRSLERRLGSSARE